MSGIKIKKILNKKSGQEAIIAIDNLLSPIFYKNPEKLSKPEKNIVFIEELEREINNGGFNQFFFNISGRYTKETLNALKVINSIFFLDIFKKAITVFPNEEIPKDDNLRQELLNNIEERANPIWEDLENKFYNYEENIYKLMIDYIIENLSDFR